MDVSWFLSTQRVRWTYESRRRVRLCRLLGKKAKTWQRMWCDDDVWWQELCIYPHWLVPATECYWKSCRSLVTTNFWFKLQLDILRWTWIRRNQISRCLLTRLLSNDPMPPPVCCNDKGVAGDLALWGKTHRSRGRWVCESTNCLAIPPVWISSSLRLLLLTDWKSWNMSNQFQRYIAT